MIDAQLYAASNADSVERERIILDLALRPGDVLDPLLEILHSPESPYGDIAMQVIKAIGYPAYVRAVPTLVSLLSDANSLRTQEITAILQTMPPEALAPGLIERFWDRGHHYDWWTDDMRGVCRLLLDLPPAYAAACGPIIAYVLCLPLQYDWLNNSHSAQNERAVRHDFVQVLAKIGPEAIEYAIPTLIALAIHAAQFEAGQAALDLLATVEQRLLVPYRRIWPRYGRGA